MSKWNRPHRRPSHRLIRWVTRRSRHVMTFSPVGSDLDFVKTRGDVLRSHVAVPGQQQIRDVTNQL